MKVAYQGKTFEVPDYTKFVAADTSGRIYAYETEPIQQFSNSMCWVPNGTSASELVTSAKLSKQDFLYPKESVVLAPDNPTMPDLPDCISLEEALHSLVRHAEVIRSSHSPAQNTNMCRPNHQHLFGIRKAGVNALMQLIENYIDTFPDPSSPQDGNV